MGAEGVANINGNTSTFLANSIETKEVEIAYLNDSVEIIWFKEGFGEREDIVIFFEKRKFKLCEMC